ncbi:MAG: LysR family transcriptional regulator [Gemmatimonadales bacterium]|nr:LysR family transcriptional regulator [Gemmatimonadales bacterium]
MLAVGRRGCARPSTGRVELAKQADTHQSTIGVPVEGQAFEILRQMRGRRVLVHRRADHVQRADARVIQRVERRIGMLGAAGIVAGVDDGSDAGIERSHRRQAGAQIHVERAIVRTQFLGDDVDIGEEIVGIGHHAPHHTEPHMMVSVDQAGHDDAAAGIHGRPDHPQDLQRHRCLQFLDPYSGRPFAWEFVSDAETVEVPTSGPLTFTDPKSMLEECVAGTGIAQVIGWGVGGLLASGALIDLFPAWHGERFPLFAFHPSRKHPPAKVRAFVDFCVEVIQQL